MDEVIESVARAVAVQMTFEAAVIGRLAAGLNVLP